MGRYIIAHHSIESCQKKEHTSLKSEPAVQYSEYKTEAMDMWTLPCPHIHGFCFRKMWEPYHAKYP